jgi:hypothetical protein
MQALYRKLLRLYPADYVREYGEEMSWVFARASDDARGKKLMARITFYAREVSGVVTGAVRQRLLGCDDSSRRLEMEFRFPRSTVVLMWVILAGLLMAIAEAKIVAMHYGASEAKTVWNMLPWFIVVAAVLVCGAGAAAWGILYALRRTGMHRMERLDI